MNPWTAVRCVTWLALVYATAAIKVTYEQALLDLRVMPDPLLVLAILVILSAEPPVSYVVLAAIGFLSDLLWGQTIGTSMVCMLSVGYLLGSFRNFFQTGELVRAVLIAWVLATAILLSRVCVFEQLQGNPIDLGPLAVAALVEAAPCALVVVFVRGISDVIGSRLSFLFSPRAAEPAPEG